jgi:hypothetical protein
MKPKRICSLSRYCEMNLVCHTQRHAQRLQQVLISENKKRNLEINASQSGELHNHIRK